MTMESDPSAPPMVRHRLIIRHPQRPEILLREAAGESRLPELTSEDRHTAEVDHINAAVAARFGLRTTVLRSLAHSEPVDGVVDRVHELETHGDAAPSMTTLQWCDAGRAALVDSQDSTALAIWLALRHCVARDGRDWMRPGWFERAAEWIDGALRAAGIEAAREIRQLRCWESSSVLLVRTASGLLYFKALPQSCRVESAVTAYLARHFADVVPAIVAVNSDRRWLLMKACPGRKLEEIGDTRVWERAARRYATLQVDCVRHVDALQRLGCPSRGLDELARSIEAVARDEAALRPGAADGLTHAEFARLAAAIPAPQRYCDELAACGVPDTIEHGDLWPGNIFADAASCAVIDWEDVAVAHPFFSLAPLTVGMMNAGLGQPASIARLEHAYAAVFEAVAPASQVKRALELAQPLCFVEMAARYRRQRPSIARLHPWMRDLVPQTLRVALARLPD
jgi:aminoglycoside phosphotransferase (APT) family kinase protein